MRYLDHLAARVQPLRCRGFGLAASRAFVKEQFGPEGWQRLLARFDEEAAAFWDGLIIPDVWYAARIFDDFLDALAVTFAGADMGERLGRRIAAADIRNRIFLPAPIGDPARAIEDGARLWRSYLSRGEMRVVARSNGSIELILENPGVHPLLCGEIVIGWGNEMVTRAGGTVVHNTHDCGFAEGGGVCRYRIAWR